MIFLSEEAKREIYEESRARLESWYTPETIKRGGCLYWAQCSGISLHKRGLCPSLRAGTMLWKMVAHDDGVSPTHFGYEWSPTHPFSVAAVKEGKMPEMHVWNEVGGMIVDFSTGQFKTIAEEIHKLKWTAPDPPRFLWGFPPGDAVYHNEFAALRWAFRFITQ